MTSKLYQAIASTVGAYHRCVASGNTFAEKHLEAINTFEDMLPHGSGIDNGTKIDLDRTNDDKITLTFGYHHMDDNGMYCGWTDYKAVITPSFNGFHLQILGQNINFIKDYLHDTFGFVLDQTINRTKDGITIVDNTFQPAC